LLLRRLLHHSILMSDALDGHAMERA
jgi:hypothetical protein